MSRRWCLTKCLVRPFLVERAPEGRKRRGLGKPETFNSLGFTFICGKTRSGKIPDQKEDPSGPHAGQAPGDQAGDATAHAPADPRTGKMAGAGRPWLFNYHGRALEVFRHHVTDLWRRTLRRRSQKDRKTWARMIVCRR